MDDHGALAAPLLPPHHVGEQRMQAIHLALQHLHLLHAGWWVGSGHAFKLTVHKLDVHSSGMVGSAFQVAPHSRPGYPLHHHPKHLLQLKSKASRHQRGQRRDSGLPSCQSFRRCDSHMLQFQAICRVKEGE